MPGTGCGSTFTSVSDADDNNGDEERSWNSHDNTDDDDDDDAMTSPLVSLSLNFCLLSCT